MKIYIFFKNDADRDDNYHSIITIMNNPNLDEFRKRFPDENDFYVEEHDVEEVEKTNIHDLSYFDIIFSPNIGKYMPNYSKFDVDNLIIKNIKITKKDCIYSSPTMYMQYINQIHHRGVYLFSVDEEHAKDEAIEIMKKFLEENGGNNVH